ncbi:hypothetical protein GTP45_23820 [Pseudoduganella sp. FT55W]|uniref:Uncharacterized protein n=1 Tax=Duganella rivi TaxID=2666083 RepID=A0A7X4KE33_9BURK|nr:hypothetical protein [Duganella rivi]MYM69850.1 hypothetical protein [Duganella rivi]
MRIVRFLLLALFILSSSAQAMASVHQCCPAADCGIVQCLDMGCAPSVPAVAFNRPAAAQPVAVAPVYAVYVTTRESDPYEEVWTPPD